MKRLWFLAVILVLWGSGCATIADGGPQTPLPATAKIVPPSPDVPSHIAAYSGVWEGVWDVGIATTIVIERIAADEVIAIYSWGSAPRGDLSPGWIRLTGRVENDSIVLRGPTVVISLTMSGKSVRAEYRRGASIAYAVLSRKN